LGQEDIVLYRTGKSTLPDEELEGFPTEYSLDDALGHEPDAVIVSNPTALHLDVAIPAAKQGCHLLLEKPITDKLDRIEELRTLVEENHCKVLVGYQFRFHPVLRQIKRLIDIGSLGRIIHVCAHWGEYLPKWHPWENYALSYAVRQELGGGVLLTLSHPIDYFNWFFGQAEAVWGLLSKQSSWNINVEDTADVFIRYQQGVLGKIHLNYLQRPTVHTLSMIGNKGSIFWSNKEGQARYIDAQSGDERDILLSKDFNRNSMFIAEMDHFLEVINGEGQPICKLEDGLLALKIARAILENDGFKDFIPLAR
jgi:predicted dehydrogenase